MTDFTERITILSAEEIRDLYDTPRFSQEERSLYFGMDTQELNLALSHRPLTSRLFFVLQLGYFKARRMFFSFSVNGDNDDVRFIMDSHFPGHPLPEKGKITRYTWRNQQLKILALFDYHECDAAWRDKLEEKARRYVRISSRPVNIFKELLTYLEKSRVVLPAYSTMQKIVSQAILAERERMAALAQQYMPPDVERAIDELFSRDDRSYVLTLLKKEPKDFKYKQISREIEKQRILKPLYDFAKDFLPHLGVSNDNITYYGSLVDFYSISRIRRLQGGVPSVYLLCFIYHRYQRLNNNLINASIYHVSKYETAAKLAMRSGIYDLKTEGNRNLDPTGHVLDLFVDEEIPDALSFGKVRRLAFDILPREKFPAVKAFISKAGFDQAELEWKAREELAKTFKKNLRPILQSLEFGSTSKKDPLMDAVDFLKKNLEAKRSLSGIDPALFPTGFIRRKFRRHITEKKKVKIQGSPRKIQAIRTDRYEFLLYATLRDNLESGDVFVSDSTQFRSFEADLIDDERWQDKEQLIRELDLPILNRPIEETLAELREEVEALFVRVNRRIRDGENQHIKISGTGEEVSWTLPYKSPEDMANHPLYELLPQIEIRDLLAFVDSQCGFMSAFTHILGRYVKKAPEDDAIAGAVIAMATNKGLFKMAESSDIKYQDLFSASKNYLRLETLKNANDMISNALVELPIFRHFDVEEGIIHSSSDGQKFGTQIRTINARRSPKYFGLKEGVASYTLVANNVPVNAKIIGANAHESHFVFDILHNNTSEIQPSRHSVDTHGTNSVNFLILNAFGYEFAPRYRDISGKTESLYGFKDLKEYKDFLLRPTKRVRPKLIISEWPNIQKILVSLGLKVTTQSVIVGKLSSYVRKNRTKRAMWELDSIFRTIYLLRYVDILLLRQVVQRVLNRGEGYHQLRRAVCHENKGEFRVDSEAEQNVWSECGRLVANAVIFYNSCLLSRLLELIGERTGADLVERAKKVSPIAWRHVNLGGRFQLIRGNGTIDIDRMLAGLEPVLARGAF